jgi:hypothetical protein
MSVTTCPPWCEKRDGAAHGGSGTHQARRYGPGYSWTAALLLARAWDSPQILVDAQGTQLHGAFIALAEAPGLAEVLAALGHADMAGAITDLIKLTEGTGLS